VPLQASFKSDGFSGTEQALSHTNLYIRGLTQNTTDEDLYSLCQG